MTSIRILSALSLVAGLAVALPVPARAQEGPIKLGAVLPMTGGAASVGFNNRLGARIGVEEINAAGGIMGRKVELIVADDQTDPTISVSETKRLVNVEKVALMIGPQISQMAIAAGPTLTEGKIAMITTGSSSALTLQVLPYGFMIQPSVDTTAQFLVKYAAEGAKAKTVALLTDNTSYGKAAQQPTKDALAAAGLKLTEMQEYEFRSSDQTAQLLALRRGNPDAIIAFTGIGEDAGQTLKNLDEIGWKVTIINQTFGLLAPAVMKVAGPDAFKKGNAIGMNAKAFTYCKGEPAGKLAFPALQDRARAAEPERFAQLQMNIVAYARDSVWILKTAADAAKSLDGPKIAAWIEENASKIPGLATGTLSASKTRHFLFGAESLAIVPRPDVLNDRGMAERFGC